MRLLLNSLFFALLLAFLQGCAPAENKPVPRREAFPRIVNMDPVYKVPSELPMVFPVNAKAKVSMEKQADGAIWLTIEYPIYGGLVHCTFTPVNPKKLKALISNRAERMMQNIGNCKAFTENFEGSNGSQISVLSASCAPMAAMQFLAVNPRWVLTGNLSFPGASSASPVDSLAPMVSAISRDLYYALKGL